ncbi:MAG TPA: MerR family transcriptional regulator [Bryobacterales bacterium]|nr:MerR family transcriptional regulator [Bryobacterales bacterium]
MPEPETPTPQIPDRLYFRIGDVSELLGVEPYVLRFWESEFPMLQPKKSKTGHREYKRKDVELLLEIKRLLYDEGFTISGARKALKDRGKAARKKNAEAAQAQMPLLAEPNRLRPALDKVRKELKEILALVNKRR